MPTFRISVTWARVSSLGNLGFSGSVAGICSMSLLTGPWLFVLVPVLDFFAGASARSECSDRDPRPLLTAVVLALQPLHFPQRRPFYQVGDGCVPGGVQHVREQDIVLRLAFGHRQPMPESIAHRGGNLRPLPDVSSEEALKERAYGSLERCSSLFWSRNSDSFTTHQMEEKRVFKASKS